MCSAQGYTALCHYHYGINVMMEGDSDKIVIPRAALRERLSGAAIVIVNELNYTKLTRKQSKKWIAEGGQAECRKSKKDMHNLSLVAGIRYSYGTCTNGVWYK